MLDVGSHLKALRIEVGADQRLMDPGGDTRPCAPTPTYGIFRPCDDHDGYFKLPRTIPQMYDCGWTT